MYQLEERVERIVRVKKRNGYGGPRFRPYSFEVPEAQAGQALILKERRQKGFKRMCTNLKSETEV